MTSSLDIWASARAIAQKKISTVLKLRGQTAPNINAIIDGMIHAQLASMPTFESMSTFAIGRALDKMAAATPELFQPDPTSDPAPSSGLGAFVGSEEFKKMTPETRLSIARRAEAEAASEAAPCRLERVEAEAAVSMGRNRRDDILTRAGLADARAAASKAPQPTVDLKPLRQVMEGQKLNPEAKLRLANSRSAAAEATVALKVARSSVASASPALRSAAAAQVDRLERQIRSLGFEP